MANILAINQPFQAQITVLVVDHDYEADLKALISGSAPIVTGDLIWHFVSRADEATVHVQFVRHGERADLRVKFVSHGYETGWVRPHGLKGHL